MAQTDLKIRRIKMYNPVQKKYGFATRAIINGTETFESVAEEAARNTTLNKYELVAALGIAAEQFARALKNGWAVDLGPIGKIYPTVSSKWTETAEEQTKSLLKPSVRFDASADIKGAVESAKLTWVKDSEEVVEEEVVEEDVELGGSTNAPGSGTGGTNTPGGSTGGAGSSGSGTGRCRSSPWRGTCPTATPSYGTSWSRAKPSPKLPPRPKATTGTRTPK